MNASSLLIRLLFAVAGFFSAISSLRANDITWQSLSMPTSAVGGTTITITAVVTNTGEDIWGGAHNLVMLDQNFTPVAMTSLDGVEPGQTVTVSFPYGFPDVAANYTFQFQALEHEVEYFGPVHSRTIAVSKAPPYEGMQLTPTTFDALAPALISTTDTVVSFPAYRLRAKVIDGTSWGWHAANRWNTNNYPLDNPPPPGNYTTCALYWVRYTSLYGNVLLPIGPERTVPISVQGTVSLSTNWAHASNPPKIYTSENMAGTTYRLFATFRNSAGAAWETSSGYNNQGASLANLPPPGSYQVDLQWKKYDPSMNVTAASAVRTANVSITDGPIVVLNADSFISGTESYNEEDGTSSIDYSVNSHDISQILVGGVLKVRGQAQDGGQLYLNAYTLSGQPLQSGIPELALPVSPGDYRITVTADREVSYSVVGELFPYAAGLSVTSIDSASGSVGTAFAGYTVTTDGTGPIVYSAPAAGTLNGLPPGLTLHPATGVISGTPTVSGIFRVWITASNAAGSGYKWVTFTITKGTPSVNFSNQSFLNESFRYISPGMLAATVTGVAGGVAPVTTGGSAVTYKITEGTVSAPTGSNPLGRYLTPWYSPITVLATYPGDANYEAATKSAVFEILVRYTPSVPSALRQVLIGPNSFSVEWQRSTGEPNTGISPDTYDISFDGGATIAKSVTSGQNSAVFNGYTPSTTYHLTVRGRDAFGNVSGWSAPLTVTTLAAGTTATYTPRWLDVNGDGLPDEVIDAGTSVFSHFVGEESTVDVTYSTWALDWSYIAGLNFSGSYYYDGYGGIFYVPGPWIPTWEEVEETISVPVVRPVFRFVAEAGYGYRIGRLSTRSNGQIVFSEVYSIPGDETGAGINEWWPPEMMAQSAYYTLPFVAVRLSRGLGSVAIGSSSVTLGGSRGAGGVLTAALGGGGGVTLNVLDTVNRLIKPGMGIVWEVWNGASQILNGATLGGLLNLGINSSGQFQVGLKLSDSAMLWFNLEVQDTPLPRLAVDANRDGTIAFDFSDTTRADAPYRFWLNDDDDRSYNSVKWSDSEPEHYPPEQVDSADQIVNSPRDCEDLARIWINAAGLIDMVKDPASDLYLGLKWKNTYGTHPSIRLFRSADTNGGLGYIKDATVGLQQATITPPGGVGALRSCLGDADAATVANPPAAFPWTSGITQVEPIVRAADFIFRKDALTDVFGNRTTGYLLFEGVQEGKGELMLVVVRKKSDNTWEKASDGGSVWLQLDNIRRMYVRAHSLPLPENFPLPWQVTSPPPGPYDEDLAHEKTLSIPDNRLWYGSGDSVESPTLFPFVPSPGEQNKCVIFVHGIDMTVPEMYGYAGSFFKRLWWEGYRGRFISFRWETPLYADGVESTSTIFASGEFRSWKGGASLKKFADALRNPASPFYFSSSPTIGLLAHSLGNACAGEALRQGMQVNSYVALKAAVSLSCYYPVGTSAPPRQVLVDADAVHPTPQYAGFYNGYHGYLSSIGGANKVNYYGARDFWLETGHVFAGVTQSLSVSWVTNEMQNKPCDPPDGFMGTNGLISYLWDVNQLKAYFRHDAFYRLVTDAHESMAFVSRPRTSALGATTAPPGFANLDLDATDTYGFTEARFDHSGPFQRDIQLMYGNANGAPWSEPLYVRLMRDLQVSP